VSQLRNARVPGSVDEARQMVAYNERIVATSQSPQRVARAQAMLANLRPHVERLEREEAARVQRIEQAAPPASTFDGRLQAWRDAKGDDDREYETVWNGGEGLTSMGARRAQ
jgi:hypothetical protein